MLILANQLLTQASCWIDKSGNNILVLQESK